MPKPLPRPVTSGDVYLNDIATSLRSLVQRGEAPVADDEVREPAKAVSEVKEPAVPAAKKGQGRRGSTNAKRKTARATPKAKTPKE